MSQSTQSKDDPMGPADSRPTSRFSPDWTGKQTPPASPGPRERWKGKTGFAGNGLHKRSGERKAGENLFGEKKGEVLGPR